jgi:hypothetical protein
MKQLLFILLMSIFVFAEKGFREGEIDGNRPEKYSLGSMADWYDLRYLVVDSLHDTISVDSTFGSGFLVKSFVNMSNTAGYVVFKTARGSVWQKLYIEPWQWTPKLPMITKIQKAGTTIDTLGCGIQVINQ